MSDENVEELRGMVSIDLVDLLKADGKFWKTAYDEGYRQAKIDGREMNVRYEEYKRERKAQMESIAAARQKLDALTDPTARAVLDLHHDDDGVCRGCDWDGFETEPPQWPCSTVRAVAEVHGINVPEPL